MRKIMKLVFMVLCVFMMEFCFFPSEIMAGVVDMPGLGGGGSAGHSMTGGTVSAVKRGAISEGSGEALLSYHVSRGKGCEPGGENECLPYCRYEQTDTCFACPIFAVIFNTVNQVTAKAIVKYSRSIAVIVCVGFAIWLALQVLAFVSSIEVRDLKDFSQAILTQGFAVMLVVAILHTGVDSFFNTFVTPVYLTGQNAAQAMFDVNQSGDQYKITDCLEGDNCEGESFNTHADSIKEVKDGFNPEIGRSVITTMTVMENYVRRFKALGSAIMCQSWKEGWFIIPSPLYFITGFAIWILSLVLIIGLPFLMVDAVFQLGVAGALLPAAIGAYAFKSTKQYTKKVWETFLNSMFAFVFISIVVLLSLTVLKQGLLMGLKDVAAAKEGNTPTVTTSSSGGETQDTATQEQQQPAATGMPSIDEAAAYTLKAEGYVKNVYLDIYGFPTVGVGHLLFRTDKGGGFENWYKDAIKSLNFVDSSGKAVSEKDKHDKFAALYKSCTGSLTATIAKSKGRGSCNIDTVKGLQLTDDEVNKVLKKDLTYHYNRTKSKCGSRGSVIDSCTIWTSYNSGTPKCTFNGNMCNNAVTKSGGYVGGSYSAPALESIDYNSIDSDAFYSMFNADGVGPEIFERLLQGFNWTSLHFVRLVFIFLLVWSVMNMATEFAGDMASSISNTTIGSSIGTMAASTVKGAVWDKAGKPLFKEGWNKVEKGAAHAIRRAPGAAKHLWNRYQFRKGQAKLDAAEKGRYVDKKGNIHEKMGDGVEKITSKEEGLSSRVTQLANGGKRTVKRMKKTETIKTRDITIKRTITSETVSTHDAAGKEVGTPTTTIVEVKEEIIMNSSRVDKLIDSKGQFSKEKYDEVLKGLSGDAKKEVEAAIAKRIMQNRFSKDLHSQTKKSKPEVVNQVVNSDGTMEITIKEVTDKGEVVFNTMKINKAGYAETTKSIVKQDGSLVQVSSDGIRNKMIVGQLKVGAYKDILEGKNIKSATDVNTKLDRIEATHYSYTKYYQNLIDHGEDPRKMGFDEEGNQLGMMSWKEAIGEKDENGKFHKGAFRAYVDEPGNEFGKSKIAREILV